MFGCFVTFECSTTAKVKRLKSKYDEVSDRLGNSIKERMGGGSDE